LQHKQIKHAKARVTKGRRREGRAKGKEGVEAESHQVNTLDWRRKDDRPLDQRMEKG